MKKINVILIIAILSVIAVVGIILVIPKKEIKKEMIDVQGYTVEQIKEFAEEHKLLLNIEEEYSSKDKNTVIFQSISNGTEIKEGDKLTITISLGIDYQALKVNELGNVPIMMYHGIHNITNNKYTGGNVDKDGYQRTTQAFENDLEFYYTSGYRMIPLEDYVQGIIDVEAGKSPIILTFDDGLENNIKVTGLDENGEIVIDPNSAIGVLERFKQKYPDFHVTATFFVNGGLFNQSEYNEKILNWLINHGYDVGNHTLNHPDFTSISYEQSVKEVGKIYQLLETYIPKKYVNIVALPFGSPYENTHQNYPAILSGTYEEINYKTISTLRVGWEAEYSPFHTSFNASFLKRIRAYDNNGKDFDIEMNFKILENNRYISDGNKDTIVVPKEKENKIKNLYNLKLVTY